MNIYILAFLLLFSVSQSAPLPDSRPGPKKERGETANIVFKSTDGGKTWQDISKGLPENLRENGIGGDSVFANDKGLFLRVGNELYHSTANATAPFWTKAISPDKNNGIASGIFTYNYWGVNLKKTDGTSAWSPVFEDFHERRIRSVFETAGGTIFVGIDRGLFRSTDNGQTWKHVHKGLFVGHLAESDGVLVAASMKKIIRSTDNGENWALVMSEDSVAFDVKQIKGGFAALTSTSASNPRGISTSYDGGKTWQSADAGGQDKVVIDSIRRTWNDRPEMQRFQTSITQVGENFFCSHPHGIFKSSDKGKTWNLLLPAVDGKVFNLFGSGNVIYAILPSKFKGGC